MNCFVYMLECGDGTLYTGWTPDLAHRLKAHRSGKGAKYTRGRGPLTLAYSQCFATKSEALRWEAHLKALSRAEKLRLCAPFQTAVKALERAGKARSHSKSEKTRFVCAVRMAKNTCFSYKSQKAVAWKHATAFFCF